MDPDELLRVAIARHDDAYPCFGSALSDSAPPACTYHELEAAVQQPMQFADQLFAAALAAREITGGDAAAAATSLTGGGAPFDSPAAALAAEGRTVLHLFEQPVAPSMFDSYSFEPASI